MSFLNGGFDRVADSRSMICTAEARAEATLGVRTSTAMVEARPPACLYIAGL